MTINECYDNGKREYFTKIYKLVIGSSPLFSCFKIKKIKPNGKFDWHFVYEQDILDILEKDKNWTLQENKNDL